MLFAKKQLLAPSFIPLISGMKKSILLLLSILSGLLLWLSWPAAGLPFLVFFGFLPLFFLSDGLLQRGGKLAFWQGFIYSYPAFLIWNVATTWWIWNSTPPGSVAAFVLNAAFMAIVFAFWHAFRKQQPPTITEPIAFIVFWMSWEHLHLNWDLTWPWLNLGNVFSSCTEYVQWYEWTGTFGGTLWILIINFLLYYLIKALREKTAKRWTLLAVTIGCLVIPLVVSAIMYSHISKKNYKETIEAVVVQQNTDPWEEQYKMSNAEQTIRLLQVGFTQLTDQTELLVCPESAIPHSVSIDNLLQRNYDPFDSSYGGFALLDSLVYHYPKINVIVGLSTYTFYDHKATPTARDRGYYFVDMFNTSACFNRTGNIELYHKSKLVPGVEKMPYPQVFGFLEHLVINLGGPSGSLGADTAQHAFYTTIGNGNVKVGAPICYESIFGEEFAGFVRDGAQVMTVITNDSWWKNTPGHKQHFLASKLRAVETRRAIARAANTGISAFIMPNGDVHQATKYETRTAIRENIPLNDQLTFYVKHGDYLARLAVGIAAIAFLFFIFLIIKNKRKNLSAK